MFSRLINRIFNKRNNEEDNGLKKYGFTTEPANVGVNNKSNLSTDIKKILSSDRIDNDNLNKLIKFQFGIDKPISNTFYKVNSVYKDGMVFVIDRIETVVDDNNDLVDIKIELKDSIYSEDISIKLSVKCFHEFLTTIN